MGLTATSLSQFATRAATARAALFAAVLTYAGTDYACVVDPDQLTQVLETGGMNQDRSLTVCVANAAGLGFSDDLLGKSVTIKTTATDALETKVFRIRGITPHPDNPETVLTLEMII